MNKDFLEIAHAYQQIMFDAAELQLANIKTENNSLIDIAATIVKNPIQRKICCCFSFILNGKYITDTALVWDYHDDITLSIAEKQNIIIKKVSEIVASKIAAELTFKINEL